MHQYDRRRLGVVTADGCPTRVDSSAYFTTSTSGNPFTARAIKKGTGQGRLYGTEDVYILS